MTSKFGFFFDLDGTLTDNLEFMFEGYRTFMSRHGLPYSKEQFNHYNGTPLKDFLFYTKNKHNIKKTIDELLSSYEKIIDNSHSMIAPREGVVELFSILVKRNIPFAIVTSSKRNIASNWIKSNVPDNLRPPLVTSDDYKEGKPSPYPYLLAMEELGCKNGYAVEDSENGVLSAFSAGLKVLQIGPEKNIKFSNTWEKISSFNEVTCIVNEL